MKFVLLSKGVRAVGDLNCAAGGGDGNRRDQVSVGEHLEIRKRKEIA
jgi:hypothetical protein